MDTELKDWTPTETHDWEGKERDVLVLNYTMRCALACDFCCYGCNPSRKEKMPFDLALRLIQEASNLKQFSSVAFTGGEPLLYQDEIIELAKELYAGGLPYTIATACHWAESHTSSKQLLKELKKHGLIRLNISHDPSHEQFVPKSSILNAARAANELGIATYIVGTFLSPNESMQAFLTQAVGYSHVQLHTKYVAKVGMATKWDITQERYRLRLEAEDMCCYRRINHDIVIWFDGTAYPCCSTFNRSTPGISIGNAHATSLMEIWERAEGSLLFRILKRQGFGELYALLKERAPDLYRCLPQANSAVGPCSLCNAIFKNKDLYPKILEVISEYERNKASHALEVVAALLGESKAATVVSDLLN